MATEQQEFITDRLHRCIVDPTRTSHVCSVSDPALLQAQCTQMMRAQHNDRAELAALRASPVASGSMADWELVRMQVLVEDIEFRDQRLAWLAGRLATSATSQAAVAEHCR